MEGIWVGRLTWVNWVWQGGQAFLGFLVSLWFPFESIFFKFDTFDFLLLLKVLCLVLTILFLLPNSFSNLDPTFVQFLAFLALPRLDGFFLGFKLVFKLGGSLVGVSVSFSLEEISISDCLTYIWILSNSSFFFCRSSYSSSWRFLTPGWL